MTTTSPTESSYRSALQAALGSFAPGPPQVVALGDAIGCVLLDSVRADRDLPPFNRSMLDGYAVRAADIVPGCALPVAAEIHAGHSFDQPLAAGVCVAIATGAPVPPPLDTVIPHEQSDRGDPVTFTIDTVEVGRGVHPHGSDAKQGEAVIEAGVTLAAHHLGIAASVGAARLRVIRPPRVTILTSGDEVLAFNEPVGPHQIRNSNAIMLAALFRAMGASRVTHQHIPDDRDKTVDAVRDALESSDMLISVGGVSAGRRDWFPSAFDAHDITPLVTGAAIQPGKPIRVGYAPSNRAVVALPGNPVSALVCAHLFAWPILRTLAGKSAELPWRSVALAEPAAPNPNRQAFRPARITSDGRAHVPGWAGSGDLVHTAPTHGLLALPVQGEPVRANSTLDFLPWADAMTGH